MTGTIKDIKIAVSKKDLHFATLIFDDLVELKVPGPLFKKETTSENFNFEILIGVQVDYFFYEVHELVDNSIVDFYPKKCFGDYDDIFMQQVGFSIGEKKIICRYKNEVLKSIKFYTGEDFNQFLDHNLNKRSEQVLIECIILGVQVLVRERSQEVILILDNQPVIKIHAFLLKKASSLESDEFEMLVGQKIKYSFYSVGAIVNELNELCELPNSLIKTFFIDYETTFAEFYKYNLNKKYPFKKIVGVLNSYKFGHVIFQTADNRRYETEVKSCPTGFTWEFFMLQGTYILSIETGQKSLHINHNLLLRLPSSFFNKIKKPSKEIIQIFEQKYNSVTLYPPYEGRLRYTNEDFIDDALGGEADALGNID